MPYYRSQAYMSRKMKHSFVIEQEEKELYSSEQETQTSSPKIKL